MGIRFFCPNGHKLNVKEFQAGRKGICPFCGAKIQIPVASTRPSSREEKAQQRAGKSPATPSSKQPGDTIDDDSQNSGIAIAIPPLPPGEGDTSQPVVRGAAPAVSAPAAPKPAATPVAGEPAPVVAVVSAPSVVSVPAAASTQTVASAPMQSGPKPYLSAPAAPPPLPADVEPAMPDPLAEAGDVVWYVRPPSGGQFGPANSDVMRTWLSEGRISADSLVWREGWREWQEAGGIFPHFRVSQVAMLATAETPALSGLEPVASHQHGVKPRRYRPKDTVTVVLLIIAFIFLLIVFFWILFRPQ